MDKLTNKQQMFVEEYLVDLNATQAAIRAGYTTNRADAVGWDLLRNTDVQIAIQENMEARKKRLKVKQDDVLRHWLEVLDRCMAKKPTRILLKYKEGFEVVEERVDDMPGAARALENLGKHVGFYDKDNRQQRTVMNIQWKE